MSAEIAPLYLLPIVGGFLFSTRWEVTRYEMARNSGHRLYLVSTFHGLWLALLVYTIIHLAMRESDARWLPSYDKDFLVASLILTPFSALIIVRVLNVFHNEFYYWEKALVDRPFERLMLDAVFDSELLMLTLSDRKVYVGFITEVPSPEISREWVGVVPVLSGYRTDTQKVEFTVNYSEAILEIEKNSDSSTMDFTVVFPVDQIVSARKFDPEAYGAFQKIHRDVV